MVVELLRGYLLTPLLAALLIFMSCVGIVRKVRSLRHGWVETHVPIVAVPGRYDEMVGDLQRGLATDGAKVDEHDAPWVLTLPALILTKVAGPNVRKLRPDRLIELCGHDMRVGVYPYDIAISSVKDERMRLRAAVMDALGNSDAHLTTSAEAQAVEGRIQRLGEAAAAGASALEIRRGLEDIDRRLLALVVSAEEWDILDRQRLKLECTFLRRGHETPPTRSAGRRAPSEPYGGPRRMSAVSVPADAADRSVQTSPPRTTRARIRSTRCCWSWRSSASPRSSP